MTDLNQLAIECGASHYSPPPLRAVRGVSFTHEQLHEFVRRVLALPAGAQDPYGWWVETQVSSQFYTAAAFARHSFDTGKFTPLYQRATPGDATAAQLEAAWRDGWEKARDSEGYSQDHEDMAWSNCNANAQAVDASQSMQLQKAAYLCVEESGVIDVEVVPPCTLPTGEYDLYAMPRSASNQAFATSKPVPATQATQLCARSFTTGLPPVGVQAAWLQVGVSGSAEGKRVVLGALAQTDAGQEWCVAGDWKAESHHQPIAEGGEAVLSWMAYEVPSASSSRVMASAGQQLPEAFITKALVDVVCERARQIVQKGRTPAHDDAYAKAELASASGAYACLVSGMSQSEALKLWPWGSDKLKSGDLREMMVISVALGLAQVEQFDRQLDTLPECSPADQSQALATQGD